jgi:hypothetical protein
MEKVIKANWECGIINFNSSENGSRTQWFILDLECGHRVGRYTSPKNDSDKHPKSVQCEYCQSNQIAISKNYDYTSDSKGWMRDQDSGLPI